MSIILSEELHRINYLFTHKRGVVISEQTAPGGLKGSYDDEKKEYTVSKGDTLGKIGKAFGVRWQDIFEKNKSTLKSKNANLIYVGEKLIIPIEQDTTTEENPKVDDQTKPEDTSDNNTNVSNDSDVDSSITDTETTQETPKKYKLPPIDTEKLLSSAPEEVKTKIKEILNSNPYAFLTVKSSYDREFPEVESELAAKQYAFKITSGDTSIKKLYLVATQNDKTKKYKIYRVDELPQSVIDADAGKSQTLSTETPKNTQAKPIEQPKPVENKPKPEQPKPEVATTKTEPQGQQTKLTTDSAIKLKKEALEKLDKLIEIANNSIFGKDLKLAKWNPAKDKLLKIDDSQLCSEENLAMAKTELENAETEKKGPNYKYLTKREKVLIDGDDKEDGLIDLLAKIPAACSTTSNV